MYLMFKSHCSGHYGGLLSIVFSLFLTESQSYLVSSSPQQGSVPKWVLITACLSKYLI